MRPDFTGKYLLLMVVCLFLSACSKKENLQIDSESQSIVDHVIADQEFMAIPALVYQHLSNTSSARGGQNSARHCAPCRYEAGDTSTYTTPVSYSFDMQESACSLNDGKPRSGNLKMIVTAPFNQPGCRNKVTFENYLSDGWSYTCDSMVLVSAGVSGAYHAYKVKVYNGFVKRDGAEIRYTCDRQVAVYSDATAPGNKAMTTFFGTSQGINRVDLAFHTDVLTDVSKPNDCRYFNAGTLQILPVGYKERTVAFGDGECDEMGSFAVSENTVAFKLK